MPASAASANDFHPSQRLQTAPKPHVRYTSDTLFPSQSQQQQPVAAKFQPTRSQLDPECSYGGSDEGEETPDHGSFGPVVHSPRCAQAGSRVLRMVMLVGVIVGSMIYKAITPPPFKVLNSPDGPKVTAPRIELRDGRHLAYKEWGVKRERASYYIVHVHGYMGSRLQSIPIPTEVMNELGLYVVSFDRAGYGQSDPNPRRSIQSDTEDVVDLADGLGLRPKFFVIATSYGSYTGWGLLKYRPERLAGVAFSSPGVNFWWPGFPKSEMAKAWGSLRAGDKLSLRVAHYLPSLTYWFNTQKRLPVMAVESENPIISLHPKDQELIKTVLNPDVHPEHYGQSMQQGTFESKYRDLMIMFSEWPFTPMTLENPFDTPVHIWQGTEDSMVPANLQKYVANSLPWVQYHELKGDGHILNFYPGVAEKIVRTLLEDSNRKFTL